MKKTLLRLLIACLISSVHAEVSVNSGEDFFITHLNGGDEIDVAKEAVALLKVDVESPRHFIIDVEQQFYADENRYTVDIFVTRYLMPMLEEEMSYVTPVNYPNDMVTPESKVTIRIFDLPDTLILEKSFPVVNTAPKGTWAINDISGTWFDPNHNGVGFAAVQARNGTIIQFYGYDESGELIWLLTDVDTTPWVKNETKILTMYASKDNGATFYIPPQSVNAAGVTKWGELSMTLTSCDKATVTLSGEDGSKTFNLIKLANMKNIECEEKLSHETE